MRSIYDRLELGDFEQVLPALEQYVARRRDYRTNRYELSAATRAEITRRWGPMIEKLGYSPEATEV